MSNPVKNLLRTLVRRSRAGMLSSLAEKIDKNTQMAAQTLYTT